MEESNMKLLRTECWFNLYKDNQNFSRQIAFDNSALHIWVDSQGVHVN